MPIMRSLHITIAAILLAMASLPSAGAQSDVTVRGIKHVHLTAPVPPAHVACLKPIDRYLAGLLTAADDRGLLPLHRAAHLRDYHDIRDLNWAVPTQAEAEAMLAKAQTDLVEEQAKYKEFVDGLNQAKRRLSEAPRDRMTRDLALHTVEMNRGILVYQGSRVRYQQAKLGFARCALANAAKQR